MVDEFFDKCPNCENKFDIRERAYTLNVSLNLNDKEVNSQRFCSFFCLRSWFYNKNNYNFFERSVLRKEDNEVKELENPCIKRMLNGVSVGERFYATISICVACRLDGLSKDEAKKIIIDFIPKCERGEEMFTEKEALTTLDWIYKKDNVEFSCKNASKLGIKAIDECAKCVKRGK